MRRIQIRSAAVCLSLLLAPAVGQSSPITYDLYSQAPAQQGGYTLTGQIVTDGVIGTLLSSDILSWHFEFGTSHASSTDPYTFPTAAPASTPFNIQADANHIFEVQPGFGGEDSLLLEGPGHNPSLNYVYNGPGFTGPGSLGYQFINTVGIGVNESSTPAVTLGDTWNIATAVVPEPSSIGLFSTGAACFIWLATRRWRKQA